MKEREPGRYEQDDEDFLPEHIASFIEKPESIEAEIAHLSQEKQAEIIDDFLNNFYMNCPGGGRRKSDSGHPPQSKIFSAIDSEFKQFGLKKKPIKRLVNAIADLDERAYARKTFHRDVFPIYLILRNQGFTHQELTK